MEMDGVTKQKDFPALPKDTLSLTESEIEYASDAYIRKRTVVLGVTAYPKSLDEAKSRFGFLI